MMQVSINNYTAQAEDKIELSHDVGVGEICGRRPQQQDALVVPKHKPEYDTFVNLAAEQKTAVLRNTVALIQDTYGQVRKAGAALCTALTWRENNTLHVWVANLGDSAAYLVVLDAKNRVLESSLLNHLHNPDPAKNSAEWQRLTSGKPPFPVWSGGAFRLGNDLALSRTLGDRYYEHYGLLHTPEVYEVTRELLVGQQAYVIVACDGLGTLKPEDIGRIVANNIVPDALMPAIIAYRLVNEAYQRGSADNISVAVIPVATQLRTAVVLDGHGEGGEHIAKKTARAFYPALRTQLKMLALAPQNYCQMPLVIAIHAAWLKKA